MRVVGDGERPAVDCWPTGAIDPLRTVRCSMVLGDMEHARLIATAFSLLLLHSATPSAADAAESPLRHGVPASKVDSASREIEFRYDDADGQRIARKLLAKELADPQAGGRACNVPGLRRRHRGGCRPCRRAAPR